MISVWEDKQFILDYSHNFSAYEKIQTTNKGSPFRVTFRAWQIHVSGAG